MWMKFGSLWMNFGPMWMKQEEEKRFFGVGSMFSHFSLSIVILHGSLSHMVMLSLGCSYVLPFFYVPFVTDINKEETPHYYENTH